MATAVAMWSMGVLAVAPAAAQPKELPATVVTRAGPAETFIKGSPAWTPANLRAQVNEGDGVRTLPGGRLAVRTASGQVLRLAQLTQIFFLAPDGQAGDRPVLVKMDSGWLWVAVMPGSPPRSQIEVRAGPASVTVRGTGAGIRLNRDGSVLIRVFHGEALCAGPDAERRWERVLKEGWELLVLAAGAPAEPRRLTREEQDEEWLRWNEEQDLAGEYGGKPPKR
ncbi:MAG TPA: FecR family protein [Methylomirabilota bacterium]|nr:FecR family protein [Methylomirabilota bacterium]